MAVASLFASCDDDDYNSNSGTTVEFESATFQADENGGIFQIPVKVTGNRNGDVQFLITTTETGENPAKEESDYMVTSKLLTLKNDTANTGTVYVEVKALDNLRMDGDRTFNVTIEGVQGANTGVNKTVTVTLVDNDKSYYAMFGGQWRFSGKFMLEDENGELVYEDFNFPMTISAASDETSSEYGSQLNCLINGFTFPHSPLSAMSLSFQMKYTFMESRQTGTVRLQCNNYEVFGFDSGINHFGWQFRNYTTGSPSTKEITGRWAPTEDNSIPAEIAFDESSILAILETNLGAGFAYGDLMTDLKITRSDY